MSGGQGARPSRALTDLSTLCACASADHVVLLVGVSRAVVQLVTKR